MDTVADLLGRAKLEAEPLYRNWQVISLARLQADGQIGVRMRDGTRIIFGARDDFFGQLAKLDYILDSAARAHPGPAAGGRDRSLARLPGARSAWRRPRRAAARRPAAAFRPLPLSSPIFAFRSPIPVSSHHTFIGAVEIGTSKVTALVGEYTGRDLTIIGYGECPSRGIVKGAIADFKAASDCAHAALEQAERHSNERIDHVYLAQTGGHLEGFYNEAAVNVKAADNMIDRNDIRTVCDLAMAKELPAGRMVVHHIRRPFRVDGRLVPSLPENLVGQRLEVGYWTVHGQEQRLADMIHVIRGCNLEVRELVLSSLASGHMITTPEERQHGIVAVDIGCGTTDYVLYRDGAPHTTGVVPIGGTHLTNDLSIGLRLTESQAEKLKLRFGRAMVQARDRNDKVWLDGNYSIGDRHFPRQAIELITSARIWELLEVVKKKLGHAFSPETCAAGVVLTGGTARLPAITECAAKVFGLPAHLGEAPASIAEHLREPGHHTALGLLYYGVSGRAEAAAGPAPAAASFARPRIFACHS